MKNGILCLAALLLVLPVVGCKAQEEIVNVPTPKPQTQTVVVKQENEGPEHYIEVSGSSEVVVAPDFATIIVEVSVRGDTAENALLACREETLKAIVVAVEQGIPRGEITLRGVEIDPTIKENSDTVLYYTATDVITIIVRQVASAEEILATLMDTGIYEACSISYSLAESSEAYRSALAAATEDALSKATVLAETAGVRLGRVIGIVETDYDDRMLTAETSESSAIAVSAKIIVRYDIG